MKAGITIKPGTSVDVLFPVMEEEMPDLVGRGEGRKGRGGEGRGREGGRGGEGSWCFGICCIYRDFLLFLFCFLFLFFFFLFSFPLFVWNF